MKKTIIWFAATFLTYTQCVNASASLSISPYHVSFKQNDRVQTVYLSNRGDATGRYEISFIHKSMDDKGNLVEMPNPDFDLSPYLRVSPKTVELKPFETQIIKLNLRKSKDAQPREYYTHMRVLTIDSDVEKHSKEHVDDKDNKSLINIETRHAVSIPVFWKNSRDDALINITSLEYSKRSEQMVIHFNKNLPISSRGFLHLFSSDDIKNERPLIKKMNIIIYGNIQNRHVIIDKKNMNIDKTFSFDKPIKAIFYSSNEKEVIFEKNDIRINVTE